MSISNPYTIVIPANHSITVDCIARASWIQRVTITLDGEPDPFVFIGQGEVVQMKLNDGNYSLDLEEAPQDRHLKATLEFSRDGNSWSLSTLQGTTTPGRFGISWIVTAEDGVDQDNDDTIMNIRAQRVS